jgi:hypothetical protein
MSGRDVFAELSPLDFMFDVLRIAQHLQPRQTSSPTTELEAFSSSSAPFHGHAVDMFQCMGEFCRYSCIRQSVDLPWHLLGKKKEEIGRRENGFGSAREDTRFLLNGDLPTPSKSSRRAARATDVSGDSTSSQTRQPIRSKSAARARSRSVAVAIAPPSSHLLRASSSGVKQPPPRPAESPPGWTHYCSPKVTFGSNTPPLPPLTAPGDAVFSSQRAKWKEGVRRSTLPLLSDAHVEAEVALVDEFSAAVPLTQLARVLTAAWEAEEVL